MMVSGERLPVLLNKTEGIPLFDPTVYVLTELRQKNRASNTIERALREIEVLLDFLDASDIHLDKRLQTGQLLSLPEIDGLVRHCGLPASEFKASRSRLTQETPRQSLRVIRMERFRMRRPSTYAKEVSPVTVANRIRTIRAYLTWLSARHLSQPNLDPTIRITLVSTKEFVLNAMFERIPSTRGRNTVGMREGASPETLDRLLKVIGPCSPENPWLSPHAQARNSLAISWLLLLGLRRGELLNVKISDIDFQKEVVTIARRADDPQDPRRKQPRTKTRDRRIPLSPELAAATHHYIITIRSTLDGARLHEFLFVADRSGVPMALDTLNRVFHTLRVTFPDLPEDLTPHILRHSWNDKFSEIMEKKGVPPEEEKKLRSFLMGWVETSDTALSYTRRHTRKKGQEVSLEIQANMLKGNNDKE